MYWPERASPARDQEEQRVGHIFASVTRCRQDAGTRRCARCSAEGELLRPAHAGRYFGGLWFKVFSERGPC